MNTEPSTEHVEWARRVNSRWIVHGTLRANTESFLDHLAQSDPARLLAACHHAWSLLHKQDGARDPKPLFYAALFSHATGAEKRAYLAHHWLTANLVSDVQQSAAEAASPMVSASTRALIRELRRTLGEAEGASTSID